jgi:hypothetical protein
MDIEEVLKLTLKERITLVSERVTAKSLGEGNLMPALTFQRLAPGEALNTHAGKSGLVKASFQIVVWAKTYDFAKAVFTQLDHEINGFRGTWQGVKIHYCFLDNPLDDTDTTLGAHKVVCKCRLMFTEP